MKKNYIINRKGKKVFFDIDQQKIHKINTLKGHLGEKFPKFAIFIVSYHASQLLKATVSRIPKKLFDIIQEIYIFDDHSLDDTFSIAEELKRMSYWNDKISIYRNVRNLGYGGNQKTGYRYAINTGIDYVILLHGDGQYPPELIPDLILPVLTDGYEVVFGSRMIEPMNALAGGMPLYKWFGNQILSKIENIILGMRLSEYHTGYRLYSTKFLQSIPFAENTNDFHFDSQIIVQCRALGIDICEVPIKTFYGNEECHVDGFEYATNICWTVLEYRLHQLHILRRSRYLVDRKAKYTRKISPYSSHEKILSLIDKPGTALDLGCSEGFSVLPLKAKGVNLVGVDIIDREEISQPFEEYYQIDLEKYEELDFSRKFDYIILSDVLEHLRGAKGLLTKVQNFVKAEGKIIISVPNIANWYVRLSLLMGRFNYGPKGILDETHVRFYTLDTLCQLVEQCGYVVTRIIPTNLPFEVIFESVGKSWVLKAMDISYSYLARMWLRMFAYQIVVECKIVSLKFEGGEGKIL